MFCAVSMAVPQYCGMGQRLPGGHWVIGLNRWRFPMSIITGMKDGDTRITDEWWLDMSGNGNVDNTIQAAQECSVDSWNIHSTWEYWPMSGNAKGGRYQTRLDENGILKCSLGNLAPTSSLATAAVCTTARRTCRLKNGRSMRILMCPWSSL